MKWNKLGLIFSADIQSDEMYVGGRTPVPLLIKDDVFKIFFASYDASGIGRVFSLKIDIKKPKEIFELVKKPILDLGSLGFFDDNGIIPSSILKTKDKVYLYTIGFSVKNKIIFDASSGLAISENNGNDFKRLDGPIIEKSIYDPCFSASPYVMYDAGIFKMWYVSCIKWEKFADDSFKHYYNIKYKESDDGVHWEVKSKVAIDFQDNYEYAISRPTVMKDGPSDYKMWYSYRAQKNTDTYRIGYAESKDGIKWIRKDKESGIDVSESGWDSEMICYPYVFDHKEKRYMFYNGNHYGSTGFGLAVLEEK
jgi:hypothetical protein